MAHPTNKAIGIFENKVDREEIQLIKHEVITRTAAVQRGLFAATLGETAIGLAQDERVNKALLDLETAIEARITELLGQGSRSC